MRNIFQYAWSQVEGFHRFIIISMILLIVGEIFGIYIPYLFGTLINEIQNSGEDQVTIAVLAICATISSHVFGWIREHIDLKKYFFTFSEKIEAHASERLMSLSLGQHMNMNSGTILETVGSGVNSLKDFVMILLFNLVPHIFYVTLSLCAITLVSWKMGFIVTALSLIYIYASITFNKLYEPKLLSLETEHKSRSKFKSEMLRNIVSVKVSGQEEWFKERYNNEISRVNNLARSIWLKYNFGSNFIGLIRIGITASVLFFGIFLVKAGQETAGTFVMFFSWAGGVTARLNSIRSNMRQLARSVPPIQKYVEMVGQEPDINETGQRTDIPFGQISFKNVTYIYPSKKRGRRRGVQNVTFEINPNEMVGIVGESGAGKSTIIKLLTRAWDCNSGGIYIDNIPLKDFASSFRKNIAFVQQEGQLFDETVRFNLIFGYDKDLPDEVLKQALEDTQLLERIEHSEEGLDTLVGERGIKLSGGERQRLLMARAIVRKTKILVLDEATSHLDVNIEERIFQHAIKKASLNTTTLIVAHRFATLKSCNRIIVMDKGRLVAFDTHDNLMDTCSIYQNLVDKQSLVGLN